MFQAAVCDVKNPPLFKEDGRVRHMGTAETKGLMLYATYSEKMITLHFSTDFRRFREQALLTGDTITLMSFT